MQNIFPYNFFIAIALKSFIKNNNSHYIEDSIKMTYTSIFCLFYG